MYDGFSGYPIEEDLDHVPPIFDIHDRTQGHRDRCLGTSVVATARTSIVPATLEVTESTLDILLSLDRVRVQRRSNRSSWA